MLLPTTQVFAIAAARTATSAVVPAVASFWAPKAATILVSTASVAPPVPSASPLESSPTALISMLSMSLLTSLRGGDVPPAAFDLTRARIRMEGLHSYVVVATLMLNASLKLFSSVPKKGTLQKGDRVNNAAKILFATTMVTSVLSGLYTTVAFSLLGMYVKTAIGMGKDLAEINFFDATQDVRVTAFRTFLVSLMTFNTSFLLSLFLNYENKTMRWVVAGVALAVSLWSWHQWSHIMFLASSLIFN